MYKVPLLSIITEGQLMVNYRGVLHSLPINYTIIHLKIRVREVWYLKINCFIHPFSNKVFSTAKWSFQLPKTYWHIYL